MLACAEPAAPAHESARDIGRGDGSEKTATWFAMLGREMAADGADDAPEICAAVGRYYAKQFSAVTIKLFRAAADHSSLRSALKAADVPTARWPGLVALLSDYLSLDFVTPAPSVDTLAPVSEQSTGTGSGGKRDARFAEVGEDTLGVRLEREGRLKEKHFVLEDFARLKLPLQLMAKHQPAITDRVLELTLERYETIHIDSLYEQEVGAQLTEIFGIMPQSEKNRKASALFALTRGGAIEDHPIPWSNSVKYKFKNRRKTDDKVRCKLVHAHARRHATRPPLPSSRLALLPLSQYKNKLKLEGDSAKVQNMITMGLKCEVDTSIQRRPALTDSSNQQALAGGEVAVGGESKLPPLKLPTERGGAMCSRKRSFSVGHDEAVNRFLSRGPSPQTPAVTVVESSGSSNSFASSVSHTRESNEAPNPKQPRKPAAKRAAKPAAKPAAKQGAQPTKKRAAPQKAAAGALPVSAASAERPRRAHTVGQVYDGDEEGAPHPSIAP